MANIQISQLPGASVPLDGTEIVPGDQGGQTVQITLDDIATLANEGAVKNGLATPQIISNVLSSRPSSPTTGTIFVATDTNQISRYNGSSWSNLGGTLQSISSSTLSVDNTTPQTPVVNLPYRSYVAVISQTGTTAPTVDYILQNTLGGAISFAYSSTGFYTVTNSSSLFVNSKTIVFINPGYMPSASVIGWERNSSSIITINSKDTLSGDDTNGLLDGATIEIRVYS
jgi:hypothetical protein